MLKHNKIILVVGGVVLILFLIVIFWPAKKMVVIPKTIKTISASVVIIPTQNKTPIYSSTGAKITILPDDQYNLMELIFSLRQQCPLKNDYFAIIYDYGIDKFIVTLKTENKETFEKWKTDTGYNGIENQYWIIKTND
jgi:hypothetical protein